MAVFAQTGSRLYVGSYDLSGDHNEIALNLGCKDLDGTTYGAESEVHVGGLHTTKLDGKGIMQLGAAAVETYLAGHLNVADKPFTVCPVDGAIGAVAYFGRQINLEYTQGGKVGDLYPFSIVGVSSGVRCVRGTVLQPAATEITTTTAATAQVVGAVGATQYAYAIMHVLSVSGTNPTLDVLIESDTVGFPSAATRFTFAQATAIGSQYLARVAGPITDTYWRASWTIGGTNTPTFKVLVAVGIV
jgi:hypothetical protein